MYTCGCIIYIWIYNFYIRIYIFYIRIYNIHPNLYLIHLTVKRISWCIIHLDLNLVTWCHVRRRWYTRSWCKWQIVMSTWFQLIWQNYLRQVVMYPMDGQEWKWTEMITVSINFHTKAIVWCPSLLLTLSNATRSPSETGSGHIYYNFCFGSVSTSACNSAI